MTTEAQYRALLEQAFNQIIPDTTNEYQILASKVRVALATQPSGPSWQDAPTCAGLWWFAGPDHRVFYIPDDAVIAYQGSSHRWFGPLPEDKK